MVLRCLRDIVRVIVVAVVRTYATFLRDVEMMVRTCLRGDDSIYSCLMISDPIIVENCQIKSKGGNFSAAVQWLSQESYHILASLRHKVVWIVEQLRGTQPYERPSSRP